MKVPGIRRPGIYAIAAAAIALSCCAALAGEKTAPESGKPLPGVDPARTVPDYRRPAPEPNDPAAVEPDERSGSFKVGDWDVRISGSVSYEMGFGTGRGQR